ncbi:MAG: uroporphyrinogen-III synthase [Alphaproteobacteria bacterium]|nr:uroporphyrinogen-III synthase [Alphaproteobacteria bacterium]
MSRRKLVIVTRPAEEAERTRAALTERGYDVLVEPLLAIEPADDASARIGDLDKVGALLFTSINGVRAFAEASTRRDLPAYAVGPTTAAAATAAGFASVHAAAGDVQALVQLVAAERRSDQGALLHPAGEAVAGDLAGELSRLGFDVRRAALYRGRPAQAFSDAIKDTLIRDRADAIAFFSPRTARTFVTLARTAGLEPTCRRLVAACLSPAVAEEAAGLGWRRMAVARTPTQDALLEALARALAEDGGTGTERTGMAEDKKDEATPTEPGVGGGVQPAATPEHAALPSITLPAAEVIQRFGGIRPMASKMNISFSTVQGWKERNHLPPARHAEILALAVKHGVPLEESSPTAMADPPPPSESKPSEPTAGPPAAAASEPPGFENKPPPLPPPLPPQTVPAPASGIGVFGAVAVSVVVVVAAMLGAYATRSMWMTGVAGGATAPAVPNDVVQRLTKLERDVASRPAAPDPKLAQDLANAGKKTAELEAALARKSADLESALTKKTAELESAIAAARNAGVAAADQAKALAPRLEALEKGFDLQAFIAVRSGLNELGGKLDALAKRMEAAERNAAAARAQGLAEAALALTVAQLRQSIDAGSPFAAELAACRAAAGGDAKVIAALDALVPHAGGGVATRATLSDEFADTARAIARASLKRSQTGWLRAFIDRLDALVTIRPVGPDVVGDDPRARTARAETLLDRGDLAGAVRVLSGLADRPAEAAKPWLDKAKARLAAEGAVGNLESQALAGLAQRAAQVPPAGAAAKPAGATQ